METKFLWRRTAKASVPHAANSSPRPRAVPETNRSIDLLCLSSFWINNAEPKIRAAQKQPSTGGVNMAVPKGKVSRQRRDKRRSSVLEAHRSQCDKAPQLLGAFCMPHRACKGLRSV
ncbi:MAG: 50S ribosomal protein L32 [Oscillospiraceae bacterium]